MPAASALLLFHENANIKVSSSVSVAIAVASNVEHSESAIFRALTEVSMILDASDAGVAKNDFYDSSSLYELTIEMTK